MSPLEMNFTYRAQLYRDETSNYYLYGIAHFTSVFCSRVGRTQAAAQGSAQSATAELSRGEGAQESGTMDSQPRWRGGGEDVQESGALWCPSRDCAGASRC